jgi:23S rRNA (cytidine1920-2'-O)/16S rRNA (cytidine1409-2'-O)-methyltransferase
MLMLVKPQFELQPADIGKGGLVRDESAFERVQTRLREACADCGLAVLDWFASPIAGGDGNREFFIRARRRGAARGA